MKSGKSHSIVLVALASGLLMALAFPPCNFYPLIWMALIPPLACLPGASLGQAILAGYVLGVAFYGGVFWWIVPAYTSNGLHWWQGLSCFLIVIHYFTCLVAVPFIAACWHWPLFASGATSASHKAGAPLLTAAVWVALECLAIHTTDVFVAGIIGYSQWKLASIIQIAALFGAQTLSFLIVAVNTSLALALRSCGENKRQAAVTLVPTAALLGMSLLYGNLSLHKSIPSSERQKIAILQGDAHTGDMGLWESNYRAFKEQARKASRSRPALVIWPESSVPPTESIDNGLRDAKLFAQKSRSWHLFGAIREDGGKMFNSAILMSPHGGLAGHYDRVRLMPFGEYVPLKPFLSRFLRVITYFKMLDSGAITRPLDSPIGPLGVLICYEIAYPSQVRDVVSKGSRYLVNLSNGAWFRTIPTVSQQLLMIATFRAIENRVHVLHAANIGTSAVIDPQGRILKLLKYREQAVIMAEVPSTLERSMYNVIGDTFAWTCCFVALMCCALRVYRSPLTGTAHGLRTLRQVA